MKKDLTPRQMKIQLAKLTKANELLVKTLGTEVKKAHTISKDQLDAVYDPANPSATQKAIDDHNAKVQQDIEAMVSGITTETDTFIGKEFSDDKLDTEDALTEWGTANKSNITYDQLMNDVPPRIANKLKQEGVNPNEVFAEADQYIKMTSGTPAPYNPTLPHDHSTGKPHTGTPPESVANEDEADEMY